MKWCITLLSQNQKGLVSLCDEPTLWQHPSWASIYHLNRAKLAIHFCSSWTIIADKSLTVDHQTAHHNGCPFRSNNSILTGILKPSLVETVFVDERSPGFPDTLSMLRPEQRPILLMRYLICNSTKPQGGVLDPFMGIGGITKARSLKPRNQNLTGWCGLPLCEEMMRFLMLALAIGFIVP